MDVSKIMNESFEMLLNRDKNLNKLSEKATDLRQSSRNLKKESSKLKMSMMMRQYMAPIVVCFVFMLFILAKFYLF